jgi:hypothetical protein
MMTHRLQILLDEERYRRVSATAKQRKTSVAAVIREAIDRGVPAAQRGRSSAASVILQAEPMGASDPRDLVIELDELRGRHE